MVKHWMSKPSRETLFVLIGTYNHEAFISQAIEGALAQKVDLPLKILVRDDASTDQTSKIVSAYASRFPNVVIPILNTVNQYSLGKGWALDLLNLVVKLTEDDDPVHVYLAFCEGDDYWTDATKLQKQVDFLRKNRRVSMVHHAISVKLDDGDEFFFQTARDYYAQLQSLPRIRYGKEIARANTVHLCSLVVRLSAVDFELLERKPIGVHGDWTLAAGASRRGLVGFIRISMAVYRVNARGVYASAEIESREISDEKTRTYLSTALRW